MVFTRKFQNTKSRDSRKTKNEMGERCSKGAITGRKIYEEEGDKLGREE